MYTFKKSHDIEPHSIKKLPKNLSVIKTMVYLEYINTH